MKFFVGEAILFFTTGFKTLGLSSTDSRGEDSGTGVWSSVTCGLRCLGEVSIPLGSGPLSQISSLKYGGLEFLEPYWTSLLYDLFEEFTAAPFTCLPVVMIIKKEWSTGKFEGSKFKEYMVYCVAYHELQACRTQHHEMGK